MYKTIVILLKLNLDIKKKTHSVSINPDNKHERVTSNVSEIEVAFVSPIKIEYPKFGLV